MRRAAAGRNAILLEILNALPAPLYRLRIGMGRLPHIRMCQGSSQTGRRTCVNNPAVAVHEGKGRRRASCVGKMQAKWQAEWQARGRPSCGCSSTSSPLTAARVRCAAKRGSRVRVRVPALGFRPAHRSSPGSTDSLGLPNVAFCRKNLVPHDPARQNCSCPPVSRLSVPVFLHFHFSSRNPLCSYRNV
jgi:hypothetical protein